MWYTELYRKGVSEMGFVVSNAQMKAAEMACDRAGISYSRMMYNAGCACADSIKDIVPEKHKRIALLCGSGNNGGDGFVIARRLAQLGFSCIDVLCVNGLPKTECAKEHFGYLDGAVALHTEAEQFGEIISNADVAVECIYGTGFHGSLPENAAKAIAAANRCPVRIAVDVPSGINSDTGEFDERCFKPTHTLVLAAMKQGLLSPVCNDFLGEIFLLDIGIPENCYGEYVAKLTDDSMRTPFPKRMRSSHKGTFGRLMNIAGCFCYNGAAAMSTKAALRSGVGLCMLAAPRSVIAMHAAAMNEATYLPLPETADGFVIEGAVELIEKSIGRMDAIAVGCGMGNLEATRKITEKVIKSADCPIIIDADGINSLSGNIDILKERKGAAVLTPHPLEFSRVSGIPVKEVQADRIGCAARFAADYGVILVLKGANTVIASPDGEVYVNMAGNAGLARGGSGDTLTGIIAAMLAQGIEPMRAAVCGVYCHALASDILLDRFPMESMLPTDIIAALPEVFRG